MRRRILEGIAIMLLLFVVATVARLFVWPSSARPTKADAVVVFAGGQGERLDRALDLMVHGIAPVLVVSNGTAPGWTQGNEVCGAQESPRPFSVLCPHPDSTRGEARMVRDLARQNGWTKVLVVTSKYHVRRTALLVDRCAPPGTTVAVVGASPPSSSRSWWAAPHEIAGLVASLTVRRSC